MAVSMAAGTSGVNRPAGSVTEIGTVTDGHSVGTPKLIGRVSHEWPRSSYQTQGSISCTSH